MGKDVRVSSVAVAQSNLTVTIAENPTVVQPNPLTPGADGRRTQHDPQRQPVRDGATRCCAMSQ